MNKFERKTLQLVIRLFKDIETIPLSRLKKDTERHCQSLPAVCDRLISPTMTRFIQQPQEAGIVHQRAINSSAGFRRKYSNEDIPLLSKIDNRYDTPSRAAIKKL